ncbi:MAG: alkyldihydroxyacetonephosphate synthase [Myxococcota bacterium]
MRWILGHVVWFSQPGCGTTVAVPTPLLRQLEGIVGAAWVRRTEADRIAYSSDMWPRHQIWKMAGDPSRHPPEAVVSPANADEVASVLRSCADHGMPIIPFGGGSGVVGGTVPIRGGVIVDTKRMNRVVAIDDVDLTVTAQGGINGMHLEEELNERGYTLGHFPSSILCSTLGGWLAARSAGQLSSKYGKIEDMVVGVKVALPSGEVMETGPEQAFDWTQIIVGSEGILGTILSGTLRIHPQPETRAYRGYRFRTVEDGLRAIRQVMQSGLAPHVVRLYDPFDSLLHSSDGSGGGGVTTMLNPVRELLGRHLGKRKSSGRGKAAALAVALSSPATLNRLLEAVSASCLLIIGFEGAADAVDGDMREARRILEQTGGVDGGEGPGLRWEKHRYNVSFKQAAIFQAGAFVDTMEVACTWSRLEGLYDEVRRAVQPHALIMAHFSHAYREGCSIYFTFLAHKRDPAALERHYERVWNEALTAVVRAGASISHHHGVGYAKRDYMRREHGAGIRLLYGAKDALDPAGVMNPGKVLPDRAVTR